MPIEFLTDEQAGKYGQFAGVPSQAQLERFFFLDDADRALIEQHQFVPESALAEIARLQRLRAIGLPSDLFADVAPRARQGYRQRVQVEEPYELRRHPEPVRSTLLAAWAAVRSGELTDNLIWRTTASPSG
jgi:Domain of unknown function (DUF4158)